ncbi:MAG: cyclic nucleotide-binding domain-containing protein [Bdellovibrio sp.]|jgi:hypothetical protein
MSNVKVVAKGEYLFKEGDKVTSLILIQSGALQLCIIRPKKNIELATVGAGQIVGEQALVGGTYTYSAMATSETKVVELPGELYRAQVDGAAQIIKVVLKSLTDRMKQALVDVRAGRMEKDSSPCPEDQVAKVFGTIYHTARYKGDKDAKNPNSTSLEWTFYRQYSQRVFGESLKRLEQATNVLVKLGLAKYEMGKPPEDPEGPDVIMRVAILDLAAVEAFFEFFQYYYYKGGKTDLLKSDEIATNFLQEFVKIGEGLERDRYGQVSVEYSKVLEAFKNNLNVTLNNDHFARLEAKGIFMKRGPRQDGTAWVSFEIKEFQTTAKIWKVLREIEKWNEKGFVDLTEDDKPKKKVGAPTCPSCSVEVALQAKFCHECGHKLLAAA